MNTDLKSGTGTVGVLRGVSRYLKDQKFSYKSLAYQGWRKHISKFGTGKRRPTRKFLLDHTIGKAGAWINVGWYRKEGPNFRRVGGHWITLVGSDDKVPNSYFVHDPSPRAGSKHRLQKILVRTLVSGRMVGKKKGLPIAAKGFWQIESGLEIPNRADVAIVDGVVGLRLH